MLTIDTNVEFNFQFLFAFSANSHQSESRITVKHDRPSGVNGLLSTLADAPGLVL